MDNYQQTLQAYQDHALAFASKFDAIPPRIDHIAETFYSIRKQHPLVVEIGCGSGKDAQEILKRTDHYLGIDVSAGLTQAARTKSPQGKFVVADTTSFSFPSNIDIVFAFASLIHLNKQQLSAVFHKLFIALNPLCVVRLSMKHGTHYKSFTNHDQFGTRTYYYYSPQEILALAKGFIVLKNELVDFHNQTWVELLLQKQA